MSKFKLTKIDRSSLSEEILEFGPEGCMECGNENDLFLDYFLISPNFKTEKEFNEVVKEVKLQLGFESFTEVGSDLKGQLISVCKCPQCGSEEIFQDL
jgi:predicted Zn-ribbon and HTH transcriptional regulator